MKPRLIPVFFALLFSVVVLRAAPEYYFGEDVSPWPTGAAGGPNEVPKPTNLVHTFKAADQFYARLTRPSLETFETYPTGFRPTTLAFGTNTATLSGTYEPVFSYASSTSAVSGGYAFSGTNTLGISGHQGENFTITFNTPQAAFGFFGSDVELNNLHVTLGYPDNRALEIPVPITTPQGSGGAFFFGIVDLGDPFTSVRLSNVGSFNDGFDFDDMTIAGPDQVCPAYPTLSIDLSQGLRLQGTVGGTYRLETTSVLRSTNSWTVLTNLVLPSSPYLYMGPQSITNGGTRFYRVLRQCP
jgi:hypothetical protein